MPLTISDIDATIKITNDLAAEYSDERIALVRKVLREIRKDYECPNQKSETSNSPQTLPQDPLLTFQNPVDPWNLTPSLSTKSPTSNFRFWD